MADAAAQYVSRAGLKLAAALQAFKLDVRDWVCTDCGSHVGGCGDCLRQHGAAKVYAVEPGYGVLDYRLRRDRRVVTCERTNALHYVCPEPCALVTIDVGWTPQRLILPAARRCLQPGTGCVVTLIKPQYEAPSEWLYAGVLPPERQDDTLATCRADIRGLGWEIAGELESPLRGQGGNTEYLWWLRGA